MLLEVTSFARAGLLGNPSDGYYGKTIALSIPEFPVVVTIYESPELRIELGDVDDNVFENMDGLVQEVQHFGYYGGIRLVKATTKIFAQYCHEQGIELPDRNFTIRYRSTVPRLVGLGGSSAICTATFKALAKFYEVDCIPQELVPTLCWHAENQELGIHCGMQDRVIQVYGGVVYMDFDQEYFEAHEHGRYVRLDPQRLPRVFLAYDPNRAEFSGIYHRRLRVLFEEKKADILAAMSEFADFAEQGAEAIQKGDLDRVNQLINANFDLRNRVFNVSEENIRMVQTARSVGASAKFAGSGGAIVGLYEDDAMFVQLSEKLKQIGCRVIQPQISTIDNVSAK
ncbi:MAG: GHMP kinase [Lentisphaeria bacterium]|nr:GHMP kinase [Lentisphaeria bacterium]